MTNSTQLPRHVLILAIVLPVAILLGILLASPEELTSMAGVLIVLGVLSIPIFLKWHYPMLVLSWNAAIIVFFLPGQPRLWMPLACVSLFISVLASILNREQKLYYYPVLMWPMIALGAVVVATAILTGGMGLHTLGAERIGGKRYFTMLFAIIGYFALSFRRLTEDQVGRYLGMYFLTGITLALGNLVYLAGEGFYGFFYLFPIDYVVSQATEESFGIVSNTQFSRLSGFTWAGLSVISYVIAKYGLRSLIDLSRPLATSICALGVILSLFGGFRSIVIIYVLLFASQFYFEGLIRTWLFPAILVVGLVGLTILIPFARQLPMSVQRSISILPIDVDPAARADAQASTDWRLRMWSVVVGDVPRHLLLGKGFTASATDHYLAFESFRRGLSEDFEPSAIAGDYHSGPLSILLPFGIWGMLAFIAFIFGSYKVLLANYRYGSIKLQRINTFLLSYFTARLIFFVTVFGGISMDLWLFAGIAALSTSLNGGVAKPSPAVESVPAGLELKAGLP